MPSLPLWISLAAEEVYWDQPLARMSALFWSQTGLELRRKGGGDEGKERIAAVYSDPPTAAGSQTHTLTRPYASCHVP